MAATAKLAGNKSCPLCHADLSVRENRGNKNGFFCDYLQFGSFFFFLYNKEDLSKRAK